MVKMLKKLDKDIYTIVEVADILEITRRTLLIYIKDKKIKAFKVGNEWRITRESLESYINKNSTIEEE